MPRDVAVVGAASKIWAEERCESGRERYDDVGDRLHSADSSLGPGDQDSKESLLASAFGASSAFRATPVVSAALAMACKGPRVLVEFQSAAAASPATPEELASVRGHSDGWKSSAAVGAGLAGNGSDAPLASPLA